MRHDLTLLSVQSDRRVNGLTVRSLELTRWWDHADRQLLLFEGAISQSCYKLANGKDWKLY